MILHQNHEIGLIDLSEKDKPWNKHRRNADIIARHYRGTEFNSYAERIDECGQYLKFKLVTLDSGESKLKLQSARFCRVRHCPICSWRKSLAWKSKAYGILPLIQEEYPKHRWLFLTLTVKNCPVTELREVIGSMNKAWTRLSQLKVFPAVGWIKSLEVTKGNDGLAHPHFHILLMVKPSYFGKDYLKQEKWCELWKQSLRVDYTPICHVTAVKKGRSPSTLVPELLKYCIKPSSIVFDKDFLLEFTRQMHKVRSVSTGGVLKEYLRELEQEPEDLVNVGEQGEGEEEEEEELDNDDYICFWWDKYEKRYKLVVYDCFIFDSS